MSRGRRATRAGLFFASGAALLAASCSSESSHGTAPQATCALDVTVDRFKELLIVDESVVNDRRARNADAGPWSFRYAMESMAPRSANPSSFVLAWLDDWERRQTYNGVPINREPRDHGIRTAVICAWLSRTPANGCDQECNACAARRLDLALAPFRLIAIANRIDLAEKPDAVGANGEGRFVFAMVDGAGDDPQAQPRPMTLIMEYRAPTNLSHVEWAKEWHALSSFPDFGEGYKAALEKVTNRFAARDARSDGRNGSALAQIRTNESVTNWIWQLREFTLDPGGALIVTSTKNTPAESFNNSAALATFIKANEEQIKRDALVVPENMLAGATNSLLYQWSAPGIDPATRRAFAGQTCNGCHTENPQVDSVFHLSPFRTGMDRVSRFLHDPGSPTEDQLTRRTKYVEDALCRDTR